MNRHFKSGLPWMHLRHQLSLAGIALVLVSLIIMTYATIEQSSRTIEHNTYRYINLALEQANRNLRSFLQLAHDTTNNAISNKTLQKSLIEAKKMVV